MYDQFVENVYFRNILFEPKFVVTVDNFVKKKTCLIFSVEMYYEVFGSCLNYFLFAAVNFQVVAKVLIRTIIM